MLEVPGMYVFWMKRVFHPSVAWIFPSDAGMSDQLLEVITAVDTLRLKQNSRHFADDIFKYIFLYEMYFDWKLTEICAKGSN